MLDENSNQNNFFTSIFSDNFYNLNKKIFKKFLDEMLDYFSKNKNKNEFGLIENGMVKEEHFYILTNILNYLNEGLNKIKNLSFTEIKLIRELNSAIRMKSREVHSDNNEFYRLIFSSINVTHNIIEFSLPDRESTPVNDTIFNYLSREVSDFGNVVLELRQKEYEHNPIATTVADLIKNTTKYLNSDQGKKIKYVFISQFHYGIADIEEACQELWGTRDCYYPESANAQYNAIMRGRIPLNTENAPEVLKRLLLDTSHPSLNSTLHTEDEMLNFLRYFSKHVTDKNTQHSRISETFVNDLSLWINTTLPNVFENIKPKPEIYNQLFSLVEKVLADPHFTVMKLYPITPAIDTCINLLKESLKQTGYESTVVSFASLFHQINKKQQIVTGFKLHYARELNNLSLICLQNEACNSIFVLKEFTDVLGTMISDMSIYDSSSKIEIEGMVQLLLKNATDRISESELKKIAINFIKKYSNESQITEKCVNLFNLTDCDPIPSQPILLTNTSEINLENGNVTNEPRDIDSLANGSEIIMSNNNQFSLASKLATSFGLGAFTGFLNGGSQIILHIAEQKNCSLQTRRFLAASLALANLFTISTLPLIYSIVENLANEKKDSLVNSQKLLTCTYAFLTNIALQSINAGAQYIFLKKSILKNLFSMLPLFAGLWMLANSEESAIESIAILGAQILTSLATSSLIYFGLRRFLPVSQFYSLEVYNNENKSIEMQNLPTKISDEESETDINNIEPVKKFRYLTDKNLEDVRKDSQNLKDSLKEFNFSLEKGIEEDERSINNATNESVKNAYKESSKAKNHVLKKLEKPFNMANNLNEELMDPQHDKACLSYTEFDPYNTAMEKIASVFKLMQSYYETTKGDENLRDSLCEAIGFAKAQKEKLVPETLDKLKKIDESLDTVLSQIRSLVSKYNTAAAGYKGEKLGADKANLLHSRNRATSFAIKNQSPENNRRFTYTGESDHSSRESTHSMESQLIPLLKR